MLKLKLKRSREQGLKAEAGREDEMAVAVSLSSVIF